MLGTSGSPRLAAHSGYDGKEFANFSEEVGLAKTRIFSHAGSSIRRTRGSAPLTGGASRYDGKSFKKFTEKEGLGNNDVMWIFRRSRCKTSGSAPETA